MDLVALSRPALFSVVALCCIQQGVCEMRVGGLGLRIIFFIIFPHCYIQKIKLFPGIIFCAGHGQNAKKISEYFKTTGNSPGRGQNPNLIPRSPSTSQSMVSMESYNMSHKQFHWTCYWTIKILQNPPTAFVVLGVRDNDIVNCWIVNFCQHYQCCSFPYPFQITTDRTCVIELS